MKDLAKKCEFISQKKYRKYAEIPIAAEAQTNFFGLPMI